MAYVSLVLDDYDESEPAGTSDEGHYRCLSCALADSACGPSAVVMVRADLSELEACAMISRAPPLIHQVSCSPAIASLRASALEGDHALSWGGGFR